MWSSGQVMFPATMPSLPIALLNVLPALPLTPFPASTYVPPQAQIPGQYQYQLPNQLPAAAQYAQSSFRDGQTIGVIPMAASPCESGSGGCQGPAAPPPDGADSIPPGGSSTPPPPPNPKEFLERTSKPEGEVQLLKEAMNGTTVGLDWLDMVKRGRAGDPKYSELANRPLVRALGAMAGTVMMPLSDNFTPPERTPWGGKRILKDIKTDLGVLPEFNVVGESWEISSHRSFPNYFELNYAGQNIKVSIAIFDKIFGEEIYGRKAAQLHGEGLPFLVKILNSGSWRSYESELKDLFTWLDSTEHAAAWRKSLNANCAFTEMLTWNHQELHRAMLRLKNLLLQRILTVSDRSPSASVWRQSLSVSFLDNLKNKPVNELIDALRFLSTMQQAGGLSAVAFETNQIIRLFIVHKEMLEKNLSVQVHPTKEYRGMASGEHSKNEAWIILDAEPGAGIYLGLKEKVSKEQFEAALRAGEDVTHLLNFIPVKAGEAFFIPAGTMHAIGAGVMLMEPQETSETTYRVYDYSRLDAKKNPRELNIEAAMAVTDWNGKRGEDAVQWYRRTPEVVRTVGANSARVERFFNENVFETYRIGFAKGEEQRSDTMGSVKAYTVVEGAVEVYKGEEETPIGVYRRGQSFMIPATLGEYRLVGLSDRSTLFLTTIYTPYISATSKSTSSVSAVIAGQPPDIQARNEAFVKRPSRGHILMLNPQGYAGPNPPLSAPDTGGQVEYVNYKAAELAKMGYKVTIVSRSFKPAEKYADLGDRRGVDFIPGTGDMVRYVFVPGMQEEDAPFFLKEETQFYNDLPTIAMNLSLFISEEALRLNVDPWDYYVYLDSHYVDGGIVGQRLVRIWDHLFINKYLRERFGEILKDQKDPDPFEDDNILNNLSYYFGMRVLTAWYAATANGPKFGENLDIAKVLKWAADKLEWSNERKERLLANAVTFSMGSGRDLAPQNYDANAIGYRLLETSGGLQRLGRLVKNLNRHVWTEHSLAQLKEDRVMADGVHQQSPEKFRELNFATRKAAERELLMGSMSESDFSGEIFFGMPPAKAVIFTSPEIAQTSFRQGISNRKATIQFVPGTDPQMYFPRESINDEDIRQLFLDAQARGVMPEAVVSAILTHPHDYNIIVEAGRMDRSKRKHLLIEAMARLPENTIMLITGEKDEKGVYDDMASRIEKLGLQDRVFLLERVPSKLMGPLMSLPHGENEDQFRLAIVASASGMEGWGMAVENGTRGGMPLIGSDRIPYAVHLKDRNDAAIVVNSGGGDAAEIERYVETLDSALSNPPRLREMASRALPIAQEYEWRALTENATTQVMGLLAQFNEPSTPIITGGALALSSRHVVIIAGGLGTRFRPYSTDTRPKQFLPITHPDRTMLQVTAERFKGVVPIENVWVATNASYTGLVKEQLPDISNSRIIGEPVQRNTGPAIASIMYWISRDDPDAVVAIVPANHFIASAEKFVAQIREAFEYAAVSGGLVTFGIPPTEPSPEYGYIQFGGTDPAYSRIHRVRNFKEKPDVQTAQAYLDRGNYLWNSDMFVWSAGAFLHHLANYQRVMHAGLEAVYGRNPIGLNLTPQMMDPYFRALYAISIDHALMEPAAQDDHVFVLPFGTEWSDVGTWQSLDRLVREGKVNPPEEVLEHMRKMLQSDGSK